MATKKAPRKNSEEDIKGNALYFFQGREGRVENLNGLAFFQAVPKLKDEQILERAKDLAKVYRTPKYSIVTRDYYTAEEAQVENKRTGAQENDANYVREKSLKNIKHTEIPLHPLAESGAYQFFFPDIYKRDETNFRYLINDIVFVADSFIKDDHIDWKKFSEEKGLTTLEAESADINLRIYTARPSQDDINRLRESINNLPKTILALQQEQEKTALDFDIDFEVAEKRLYNIAGRVSILESQLKEKEAKLFTWIQETKPVAVAEVMKPLEKELSAVTEKISAIYMEFVHIYATSHELTTDSLETWLEKADLQDFANAEGFVTWGNAERGYGRIARPLTREDERAQELSKLKN